MKILKKQGLGARMLLAAMGGLASMVAGVSGHYHQDRQTPARQSRRTMRSAKSKPNGVKAIGRGRGWTGEQGAILKAHFDKRGIVWSAKKNKQQPSFYR